MNLTKYKYYPWFPATCRLASVFLSFSISLFMKPMRELCPFHLFWVATFFFFFNLKSSKVSFPFLSLLNHPWESPSDLVRWDYKVKTPQGLFLMLVSMWSSSLSTCSDPAVWLPGIWSTNETTVDPAKCTRTFMAVMCRRKNRGITQISIRRVDSINNGMF